MLPRLTYPVTNDFGRLSTLVLYMIGVIVIAAATTYTVITKGKISECTKFTSPLFLNDTSNPSNTSICVPKQATIGEVISIPPFQAQATTNFQYTAPFSCNLNGLALSVYQSTSRAPTIAFETDLACNSSSSISPIKVMNLEVDLVHGLVDLMQSFLEAGQLIPMGCGHAGVIPMGIQFYDKHDIPGTNASVPIVHQTNARYQTSPIVACPFTPSSGMEDEFQTMRNYMKLALQNVSFVYDFQCSRCVSRYNDMGPLLYDVFLGIAGFVPPAFGVAVWIVQNLYERYRKGKMPTKNGTMGEETHKFVELEEV